jgi:arsenical pump membrane protein
MASPDSAIRDRRLFRMAWVVLTGLVLGYFASQALDWPVAMFAGSAAIFLLAVAYRSPAVSVFEVIKKAPWKIVVFSIGMYVVVFGLRNVGLTHLLSEVLMVMDRQGGFAAILGTGLVAALVSSVMNNMPTVMINALAIHQLAVPAGVKTAMAYANVVGCDLGPKITPIGSLATLLWLHVLERRGVRIGWGYYCKVGILMTLPVLLVTLTALWGWSLAVG